MDITWAVSGGELLILLIVVPLIVILHGILLIRFSEYTARIHSIENQITQINRDIGALTRALALTDATVAAGQHT